MKTKILNILLLVTFLITILVPFTGIIIHKLAATLFLLLCLIHTIVYRKKMNGTRFAVVGIILLSFLSGVFGLIYEEVPLILALHKVTALITVVLLAIHIYKFHRKFLSFK